MIDSSRTLQSSILPSATSTDERRRPAIYCSDCQAVRKASRVGSSLPSGGLRRPEPRPEVVVIGDRQEPAPRRRKSDLERASSREPKQAGKFSEKISASGEKDMDAEEVDNLKSD